MSVELGGGRKRPGGNRITMTVTLFYTICADAFNVVMHVKLVNVVFVHCFIMFFFFNVAHMT